MNEKKYYTGLIPDIEDNRDFQLEEFFGEGEPFDWDKGYDIEEDLGIKLKVNNQGSSGSCVGQAKSKDREIKEFIEIKQYELYSARSIYARRSNYPQWGMYLREGCLIEKKIGIAKRKDVPDYQTEEEMNNRDFLEKDDNILKTKSKKFFSINYLSNIDKLAKAIRDYKGAMIGFRANNNGSWDREHPVFPKSKKEEEWGHAVFVGKAKKVNGEKRIYFLNSWGEKIGNNGWQYFTEQDLNPKGDNSYTPFFMGWVTVDLPNNEELLKKVKIMKDNFLEKHKGKTILIQDVEGTGEIAVLIDGVVYRGELNKVLGTYLVRTQGKGIPKELWEELDKKSLP